MSLSDLSTDVLLEARVDIDHQIAALRERKLTISRELESRFPDAEPQDQPAAQAVTPGLIESESGAFGLGDPEPPFLPSTPEPRRRWWR